MENIVGLKEFRMNVEKYARAARAGTPVIVVRRSKPMFRVSSIDEEMGWEKAADFMRIKRGGVKIRDLLSRL